MRLTIRLLPLLTIGALCTWSPSAFGHFDPSLFPPVPGETRPELTPPEPEPLFDEATTNSILYPTSATCAELNALSHEAKDFLLDRLLHFQVRDALTIVVGPNCEVFGETEALALISDPGLLLAGTEEETLFFLPEYDMLFVSHTPRHTLAYGMPRTGTGSPLDYFLTYRKDAEIRAEFARSVALSLQAAENDPSLDQFRSRTLSRQSSSPDRARSSTVSQRSIASKTVSSATSGAEESGGALGGEPGERSQGSLSSGALYFPGEEPDEGGMLSEQASSIEIIGPELPPVEEEAGGVLWPIILLALTILGVIGYLFYKRMKEHSEENTVENDQSENKP